jgi:hypothetical protein
MKFLFLGFLLLLFSFEALPQERRGHNPQKRIQQLEKIKLVETLELNDETAVKLFNIKDSHQKNMLQLREKSDEILDKIEETLLSGESTKTNTLNKLVQEFKFYEEEIYKSREKFLSDIESLLKPEKYAEYLVFERNFKTEIRDLIMGERMKRRKNPN